ncbi:MAG: ABC transporter substrate-binding protein [Chloroflexota bacterium]
MISIRPRARDLRRPVLAALVAAATVALIACGSESDDPAATSGASPTETPTTAPDPTATPTTSAPTATPTSAAEETETPASDGSQQLKIRQYNEPASLDPAYLFRVETENVAFQIYSGLTTFNADGEILPDLAESWELSDDGTSYTFDLVEDAEWQAGYGELTAEDVKWSYDRVLDQENGSPYRAEFSNVESVEAPDDGTVVINMADPDTNFLYQVSSYHQGQIVKKEAVEEHGEQYMRNPVGTGPYEMIDWVPNSQMTLRAHDGYYKGEASIKELRYILIQDEQAAEAALVNQEVDVAMRHNSNEAVGRLMDNPDITVHRQPNYGAVVWMLNPDQVEAFGDRKVRQAWAHAIDDEMIINELSPYTSTVAHNIIPSWMPVYEDDVPTYPYDPGKARDLLAEAGYEDGFSVKAVTTGVDEADQTRQAMLADVGIDLQFEIAEPAIYNQRRQNGDFEVAGRLYPAVNPDTVLFGYLHPDNAAPNGLNGVKYDNPEMTELLEAARAETDPEAKQELYSEIQVMAMTELPYVPYAAGSSNWGAWNYVEGIEINGLGQVPFYPVTMDR